MILVRAPRFVFGMMFGVGIGLSRRSFPACSALLDSRKYPLFDNMEHSSDSIQWNIQFTQLIDDWEVGELASFYK